MMKNIKKTIILTISIVIFAFGITVILKSDMWDLGSIFSMNLAGSFITVFSGIFFLLYFFKN